MSKNCWLIGAGYMATEYIKVLQALDVDLEIITRGEKRAIDLASEYNVDVKWGSLDQFLSDKSSIPDYAIVAVSVEELYSVTMSLINAGVKYILVEKPVGLTQGEIDNVASVSQQNGTKIYVAYNRRFYASISQLKKAAQEDGGITSVSFEFTEWVHTIDTNKFPPSVLDKFLIANSTHVIDTVFFLAGRPKTLSNFVKGNMVEWHKAGSIFVGSGITENDVLFSYSSNWAAPGRWSIEVCTNKRRYYLKPMERLAVQEKGTVQVKDYDIDYLIDEKYKPGLINMVNAFFNHDTETLCTITEHQLNFPFYDKISGYKV